MRVTVCELPHEPRALDVAWSALCEHTVRHASELVLLPELAMAEPVWESSEFDESRWRAAESRGESTLRRLAELRAACVVSTRAVREGDRRLNQAYVWSATGVAPLRSKYFLPEEPGSWEATWFDRGDAELSAFRAGPVALGVNICTELWALESYAAYAALGVELVLSPRATASATAAKWLAAGVVAAVRSGAFCLSSNRVDASGACGGRGWIIAPSGDVLATTCAAEPFATCAVDLAEVAHARASHPRYVFSGGRGAALGAQREGSGR